MATVCGTCHLESHPLRCRRRITFDLWVYSSNSDGLSLMDVAVLTNNTEMVKLLIQHGAREGMECKLLLFCFFVRFVLLTAVTFSVVDGIYQMAVKNRLVCISPSYSTTQKNSWKRKTNRRPVRSESNWTRTWPCGSAACASSAK